MAGGGGHGGAWKVAFADFMTAMMALFLVLWISAQDKEILIATSKYFQQPFNSPMDASSGVISMDGASNTTQSINDSDASSLTDLSLLNKLAQDFYKMLEIDEASTDAPVEVEVTNDGLRITVFNRTEHEVFVADTAEFTQWGRFLVENVAWLVARNRFKIRVDGHTSTGFTTTRADYTAWELSADRANAMRRGLQHFAVPGDKFERVTGFGDTVPLVRGDTAARANERVEISLVVLPPLGPPPAETASNTGAVIPSHAPSTAVAAPAPGATGPH